MTTGSLSRSVTNFNWYHLLDEQVYMCVCVCGSFEKRIPPIGDEQSVINHGTSTGLYRRDGSLLSFFQFTSLSLSLSFFFIFLLAMCETWVRHVSLLNRSISFLLLFFFFLEGIYRFPINLSCEPLLIKINPFTCIYMRFVYWNRGSKQNYFVLIC